MEEIIKRLYVGDEDDYTRMQSREGWSFLRATKEGVGGHRQTVGYHTQGAPEGKDYLSARRGKLLALNLLDSADPDMIPDEVLDTGLKFIKERMDAGDKVLVSCHSGASRSQTLIFMYLRAIGELPQGFQRAQHVFKTISPRYDPGVGMRAHARERWKSLPNFFGKK